MAALGQWHGYAIPLQCVRCTVNLAYLPSWRVYRERGKSATLMSNLLQGERLIRRMGAVYPMEVLLQRVLLNTLHGLRSHRHRRVAVALQG